MKKNIIFWGAKFKAGIIYNLVEKNKILVFTRGLFLCYWVIWNES